MRQLLKYLVAPLGILVYLVGHYFYQPFRLPDYLGDILYYSNLRAEDMDEIVEELNSLSTYGEERTDGRADWVATNYAFRRDGTRLVIHNPRMNNWAAKKIIANFRTDREFLRWRLSPKVWQDEAKRRGENTPSWADALGYLKTAGFTEIVLTSGQDHWRLVIGSAHR